VHAARLQFDIKHSYVGDLTIKLVSPSGTAKEIYRGSGSGDDVHFDEDVTAAAGGQAGKGIWKLLVIDDAAQDSGTLQAFQLTLTAAKFQCD
jgi:subtilisin-like proprotein convertase family protein